MLFGTLKKLARINQFSVTLSGFAIKRVTEFKYLGVSKFSAPNIAFLAF